MRATLAVPQKMRLAAVAVPATGLAVALATFTWLVGPGAQDDGQMVNCPQAGKWSIAVWDGPASTDAGQAFATCGEGVVAAAYYIDPDTQVWSRWFAGRPDISNLSTLNEHQGVLALGAPESTGGPSDHRISIRVVDGVGEFYDRETGEKFVPRGNNYNKIAWTDDPIFGHYPLDLTLSLRYYNPDQVKRDFQQMREMGYNIVRIMPETCAASDCIGLPNGKLNPAYIDNLVDFLHIAKEYGIYVWISSNTLPDVGYYVDTCYAVISDTWDGGNIDFLHPQGVSVYKEYFADLIQALLDRNAPLDIIFSYELRNEQYFQGWLPPLSLDSGSVTTANGQTYDMAKPEDKERMMEEGIVYWIDQLRATIVELDATALVSIGFFAPNTPHVWRDPDDLRVVRTRSAIWESAADFFDLHAGPWPAGLGLSMEQTAENYQMQGMRAKPIVMGEITAFGDGGYTTSAAGARALQDWQVESCDYGFDGWLTWSWDAFLQADIWHAMSGNGEVAQVLSPKDRPDPCETKWFDFFENNIALGKPVTASRSRPEGPPSDAVDGTGTPWISGDDPPQWIEVDLNEGATIEVIRLIVEQWPDGETVHQIWGGGPDEDLRLLHEFSGYTTDNQTLEYKPPTPLMNLQIIRVVTLESPSWVAWKEIEILASEERGE